MLDIKITSSQVTEVLMKTSLVENRDGLINYYTFFQCLEGKPVIEQIDIKNFRLITYNENYEFYRKYKPNVPFDCILKVFNNDTERYLELLKQLFHGKARSYFNDKYIIINSFLINLTTEEIASKIKVKPSKIETFKFTKDKYEEYLKYAMKIRKRTIMQDVINYIKSHGFLKKKTENYILKMVLSQDTNSSLTYRMWNIIKWVLGRICDKFVLLNEDDQIIIISEINQSGMNILNNHFNDRCNELLAIKQPFDDDEFHQPSIH